MKVRITEVGPRDGLQNEKSVIEDIGEDLRKDLTIHLVSSIDEVIDLALSPAPAPVKPPVFHTLEPFTVSDSIVNLACRERTERKNCSKPRC